MAMCDITIVCPRCLRKKKYYSLGLCKTCHQSETYLRKRYYFGEEFKKKMNELHRKFYKKHWKKLRDYYNNYYRTHPEVRAKRLEHSKTMNFLKSLDKKISQIQEIEKEKRSQMECERLNAYLLLREKIKEKDLTPISIGFFDGLRTKTCATRKREEE